MIENLYQVVMIISVFGLLAFGARCVFNFCGVANLTGHSLRVLYLAMSSDGQAMVIGAGDETLQFRNIFPSMKTPALVKDTGVWSLG
ncbi:unnamed protein product, partial [Vitis vinifera]